MLGSAAGSQCSRGYNVRRGWHPPRSNRLSPTAPMAAPASTCLVRRYICRNRDAHAGGRQVPRIAISACGGATPRQSLNLISILTSISDVTRPEPL